jgi:hypothetical protein
MIDACMDVDELAAGQFRYRRRLCVCVFASDEVQWSVKCCAGAAKYIVMGTSYTTSLVTTTLSVLFFPLMRPASLVYNSCITVQDCTPFTWNKMTRCFQSFRVCLVCGKNRGIEQNEPIFHDV